MVVWNPKDPGENKLLRFQFANQLEVGELIVSQQIDIVDNNGLDPNEAALVLGSATIVGSDVVQSVGGGLTGAAYYFKCFATTSTGRRHLVDAVLPVIATTGL